MYYLLSLPYAELWKIKINKLFRFKNGNTSNQLNLNVIKVLPIVNITWKLFVQTLSFLTVDIVERFITYDWAKSTTFSPFQNAYWSIEYLSLCSTIYIYVTF